MNGCVSLITCTTSQGRGVLLIAELLTLGINIEVIMHTAKY